MGMHIPHDIVHTLMYEGIHTRIREVVYILHEVTHALMLEDVCVLHEGVLVMRVCTSSLARSLGGHGGCAHLHGGHGRCVHPHSYIED